jgi:hypothetical protein
LNINR